MIYLITLTEEQLQTLTLDQLRLMGILPAEQPVTQEEIALIGLACKWDNKQTIVTWKYFDNGSLAGAYVAASVVCRQRLY
jgi:hypothetical protein